MPIIKCITCGKQAFRKKLSLKGKDYCSPECKKENLWGNYKCEVCGKEVEKLKCAVPNGKVCCGVGCARKYTSTIFTKVNIKTNKTRMTPEVKAKLRASHIGKGEGKTYTKTYSRHTHRVIAEEMLGRQLLQGEIVHHINGDKRDNRPENLHVFASQAEHAKHHMLLKHRGIRSDL